MNESVAEVSSLGGATCTTYLQVGKGALKLADFYHTLIGL